MSNGINRPYGLEVVQSQIGNGGTQKLGQYFIYASADGLTAQAQSIFKGDPVKWVDKGTPNSGAMDYKAQAGTIVPQKVAITAADTLSTAAAQDGASFVGVFMGCQFIDAQSGYQVNSDYWPGGRQVKKDTKIIAFVNDDPMAVFRVQVSVSVAADVVKTIYLNTQNGLNANLNIAGKTITNNTSSENPRSGSNIYGSAYYLDGSSIANTNTLDVKIIGIDPVITGNANPTGLVPGVNMPFTNLLVKFNKHVYGSVGVIGPDLS
jgi:hypothetical protein